MVVIPISGATRPRFLIVADIVMVGGLAFTICARVVLAGNLSASLAFGEWHELIVRGPYR